MQQAEQQREVGARRRLQVQAAGRPRRGAAVADRRGSTTTRPPRPRRPRRCATTGGMVSARLLPSQQDGVGAAEVRERERQPAVDAEGAVRRRRPPTTCRTGRCSRCSGCRRATRANLPSAYAFSFVSPPPPNTATASRPCVALQLARAVAATRSSASSQLAGCSSPSSPRTSGRRQPVRGGEQLGRGPALLAQAAAVGREVAPADRHRRAPMRRWAVSVVRALQGAVRAVGVGAAAMGQTRSRASRSQTAAAARAEPRRA